MHAEGYGRGGEQMKDLTPVFFPESTRYARPNEGVPAMELPKRRPEFDIDAYMAWEEDQPERHEYLGGEAFAMSGGTDAHYTILGNAYAELRAALAGKPCRAFLSGMKLRVDRADAVFYPDVFVTCDPRDRQPEASLAKQHPALIVEVLSDSTAAFDRGRDHARPVTAGGVAREAPEQQQGTTHHGCTGSRKGDDGHGHAGRDETRPAP